MDQHPGFREFVVSRAATISRTAYLLTGDHQLAEDLLQVALTRLASRWSQLREGAPEAYVRRIMINELTSWRRRRRYHERPSDVDPVVVASGNLEVAVVRRIVVARALARLGPAQSGGSGVAAFEDLSEAETEAALGCAVGTVKSSTHKALAQLRAPAPELSEFVKEVAV